jgi:hypothetical protein
VNSSGLCFGLCPKLALAWLFALAIPDPLSAFTTFAVTSATTTTTLVAFGMSFARLGP